MFLWVRGLMVLDVGVDSAIGVQFSASGKYHVMLTLGKVSTLLYPWWTSPRLAIRY